MEHKKLFLSGVAALIGGLAQTYFLLWCWSLIAAYSPFASWLVGLGIRGIALRTVVGLADTATTVILCIPAACLLLLLRPRRLWLYTLLAVLPSFVWLNRELPGTVVPLPWGQVILGWVPELLALPGAVCLVRFIASASNNSFKPNPLRGSA